MAGEPQRPGVIAARLAGAFLLLAGAYLVLRPFLVAIAWGAILAYVSHPLFRRARDWSGRPRATAAAFTAAVALGVGIPVSALLVALAQQAAELLGLAQGWARAGAPLPAGLAESPWIGPRVEELRAWLAPGSGKFAEHALGLGRDLSRELVGVAGGIARNAFSAAIAVITLYAFYLEGDRLVAQARRLAPVVFPHARGELVDHVGAVVRAVVFGLLGTALVQGTSAGIGLALFGVPSPVALGALTVVLSFVPAGPPLVWGGAAVGLAATGRPGAAVGMALWGLLLVSSVDNVLRPLLISSGPVRIPFLVVFFGVLGGLAAFGLLGLFLGPVLLSVAFALLADFPGPSEARPARRRPR